MTRIYADRVKETTTTTGTGTLVLGGAVTGYRTFLSAVGEGNTCTYAIDTDSGSEWETGIGTVSGTTLARTIVLASSNSGSLVSFSTGTKNVFLTLSGAKVVDIDTSVGSFNTRTGAVSLTSSDVTTALTYTPYNATNPSGYITGITGTNVTTALGYTPYDAANPTGYITSSGTAANISGTYAGSLTSSQVTTALTYTPYDAANPSGYTSNTGTVTSVSVTTANGVSGSVATATSTPAITLTLGAITPSSIVASGTITGSNISGTNTGDQINISGNAATVTTNANLTGDVTSVGNATTLGTVVATKGGTAQTTYTTGDILYASATNTLSKLAIGSTNNVLTVTGGVPVWSAPSGGASYMLQPVRLATTTSGTMATSFANGSVVDGVALVTGDRILIKNQASVDNGIYTVNASGAPTRAADFTTGAATLTGGVEVYVLTGNVNVQTSWTCINATTIIIGSSVPSFQPTSQPGMVLVTASGSGYNLTNTGTVSVTIGASSSNNGGSQATLIGYNTSTASNYATAIGCRSTASVSGTAIGEAANAFTSGVAIGTIANANGSWSGVTIGALSSLDFNGQINICNGQFAAARDIATGSFPMWMTTTNATATELGTAVSGATTTPTGVIVLANNSSYIFSCDIVARVSTAGTDYSMWNLTFACTRGAAAVNTSIVGTPVLTLIGQSGGASAWTAGVTADTTNGRPAIKVTGAAATTIRWVSNTRMTKVSG